MASINELPENVLLELFSLVPARVLLRHCRPVCSLWRDLIDLVSLWKRKCQREGFISENWDQPVVDWKVFYFLCSLQRNLIRNPCAQEGLKYWTIDKNGGDNWKVENTPGAHGKEFPDPRVKKYFVTSYQTCLKSQMVNLQAEGYWKELMDTVRPDIVIKDWSPTHSPTTPQESVISASSMGERTLSTGLGGTAPESPTAASPLALRSPGNSVLQKRQPEVATRSRSKWN
ncbi:F-box only protein 6-like isoform X2 [Notamacropus eugenii]|uniref:F-box only protein 6-like isoform X2 n=1 Tax=Notamacropus eugenii TaxID=9315 RepID=UPI003B670142